MTNGEKLCIDFPNMRYTISEHRVITTIGVAASFDLDWWNAEYKESTTKTDLGVDDEERTLALMYLEQIKDDYIEGEGYERHPLPEYYAIETAIKSLELPSVTPRPRKGHWIMTHDYFTGAYESIDYVKCSCCHEDSLEEGNYCPNCGAKMIEPQKSEE